MVKINLGSGQRRFGTPQTPWVNVDINPRWNPDIIADGAHMPMFGDGSADLIVSHHNLEHYGCGDAAPMLQECRRILCDGGSLIVCVPDMRALAHGWLQGRITDQVYLTNVYGAFMDSDADRHKWGFTYESLRLMLLSCGFSRVSRLLNSEIAGASVARDWWILAVEARPDKIPSNQLGPQCTMDSVGKGHSKAT